MSAWMDWIREAALSRIDTVERDLRAHPERSPSFGRALRELHAALDETEANPNEELTARDDLRMGYTAALALGWKCIWPEHGTAGACITPSSPASCRAGRGDEQHDHTDP